ncbi:hypothetical protein BP6252_04109 [Coleophoma cylindrospora]|uniref:N-acetyltransferase domain-containing protein n=1 Tax=Coleophoma cylindrospora TaxID=1849047 RepID=A0A3D8S072_9HELO|nr:hypothetical protein BP6252_04109 [Coleophoma cylindrospora]
MSKKYLLSALLAPVALATPASLEARDQCSTGYSVCAPAGATLNVPKIGDPAFQNLYVDLVQSPLTHFKREPQSGSSTVLCCNSSLDCLLMANLLIPFCYDKFTTNFHLPDGSYGTILGGNYSSLGGDTADLVNGVYTLVDGKTGDIYSSVAPPDIGTLAIPSQYRGTGVGSAIPLSSLGFQILTTITKTIPATTVAATTIPESTLAPVTQSSVMTIMSTTTATISNSPVTSVISTASTVVTTKPATTIPVSTVQATTISAITTTLTSLTPAGIESTSGSATSSGTASASSTGKSAALRSMRQDAVPSLLIALAVTFFYI